jgi:chitinase
MDTWHHQGTSLQRYYHNFVIDVYQLTHSLTHSLTCLILLTYRARNYIAYSDGVNYGSDPNKYLKDSCPHCLSRGGTGAICGTAGGAPKYDIPLSAGGSLMPADPQMQYAKGQEIEVDILLTAHHKGHFEFFACPIAHGEVPTANCFESYPLEFISDPLYGAPKDPNYPNRAYIAPATRVETKTVGLSGNYYRFKMKLPNNLTGDLVLLQWHYLTANSCSFEGYDAYPFPTSWGNMGSLAVCQDISADGNGSPEQFWNCAEISISDGPVTPSTPAPVPPPTPAEPNEPYGYGPTPAVGSCGDGSVGNGICANTAECCSKWGWCSPSTAHCGNATPETAAPIQTSSPVQNPAPVEPVGGGACGDGSVGNGICANAAECCSKWGWCGPSTAHCGNATPETATPVLTPAPVEPVGGGTCGGGSVGNGICANTAECCSKWGWCGSSTAHCTGDPPPTPQAPPLTTTSPVPEPITPLSPVRPIPLPDYADGECTGTSDVMTVNVGYYQSWAIYRDQTCNKVLPADIDVSGNEYTHLIYSFASINANNELEAWAGRLDEEKPLYDAFTGLKNTNAGLKTLIAVGGWTFNDPGATRTRFSDTAATAATRAKFAASCVTFCRTHGFDGVDLDWEYPGDTTRGGSAADKANYGLFVQAIRDAFDAASEDLELSMAVPVAAWRLAEGYDLPALAQGLDFFNLMAYDIHGAWDNPKKVGANADMPFIFDSVKYFLDAGVPSNKLVLGLAAYGRTYFLDTPSCNVAGCGFSKPAMGGCAGQLGFMAYFTIDEYIKSGEYDSLAFNSGTGTMEMVVNDNVLISFDNPATMNIKATFAAKACFRGYMWWAVDMKKDPIVLTPDYVPPPVDPTPSPVDDSTPSPVNTSTPAPVDTSTPAPVGGQTWQDWVMSTESRCGSSEVDARGNCRDRCAYNTDCDAGQYCWGVHANYCGSKPQPTECNSTPKGGHRCGVSELVARETCGMSCTNASQCNDGESCHGVNVNFCECDRRLRGKK